MKTATTFVFEAYLYDPAARLIRLQYSFDGREVFEETISLPADLALVENPAGLDAALQTLHLIGGISYYKAICPPEIRLASYGLTPEQAAFWDMTYTKGLGEFFYRNRMDFRGLVNFPVSLPSQPFTEPEAVPARRYLVPFGGGKDSLVTAELARSAGADATLFRVGPHAIVDRLAAETGLPLLTVDRRLDPKIFEWNASGVLNGHVPATAYNSALAVVVALLTGHDAILMSNERSATVGNVDYLGMEVNHQWSKSEEFETGFRRYVATSIRSDIAYLNPLRPFSELKIASLLAPHRTYLPLFTSCNTNWKQLTDRTAKPRWCGACPKCAFVFTLLAAVLPAEEVTDIFGANLFQSEGLLPIYRELFALEGIKPLECVGTPEEMAAAFFLARQLRPEVAETPVGRLFEEDVLPRLADPEALVKDAFTAHFPPDFPQETRELLQKGTLI